MESCRADFDEIQSLVDGRNAFHLSPEYLTFAHLVQFSSFVLLVGRVASSDLFEPKHAIIIKDKDDLLIPLLADPLPTAGEFRDAISSLSPEQQRFAQAYR